MGSRAPDPLPGISNDLQAQVNRAVTQVRFLQEDFLEGEWQPTPVFLLGESQGWGSLVGCRLWGRTESDTAE